MNLRNLAPVVHAMNGRVMHHLSDRESVPWAIANGKFDDTVQILVPEPGKEAANVHLNERPLFDHGSECREI